MREGEGGGSEREKKGRKAMDEREGDRERDKHKDREGERDSKR